MEQAAFISTEASDVAGIDDWEDLADDKPKEIVYTASFKETIVRELS